MVKRNSIVLLRGDRDGSGYTKPNPKNGLNVKLNNVDFLLFFRRRKPGPTCVLAKQWARKFKKSRPEKLVKSNK